MVKYRVVFARIGRSHTVEDFVTPAVDADDLAQRIYHYARPHLRSRDVEVNLDLDNGKGLIVCGMRSGGEFTVQQEM